MKKNNIKFVSLIGAAILAFGCNKVNPVEPEIKLDTTPLTVAVTVGDETKTTLGGNDGDASRIVTWNVGDSFKALHRFGTSPNFEYEVLDFTYVSGAGSQNATFTTETPHAAVKAGDIFYAFYGCEISENKLPIWPTAQLASTTGTLSDNNISGVPMFAKTDIEVTPEPVGNVITLPGFAFKNAGGYVQIYVTNNTETSINPDDLIINGVKSGEFNLPVFDGDNPSFTFTSNAKNAITWNYDATATVGINSTAIINVALPAAQYSGLKFTYTGKFGSVPYGFIRTLKDDQHITIERSKVNKISMKLFNDKKELDPANDPVGEIGKYTDLNDPHCKTGRNGIIVGFDFSDMSGNPKSKLIIATANMVLNGKDEDPSQEIAWNPGTLMTYNQTHSHTSGGNWRLMTKAEAEAVIATDTYGTGQAKWGSMKDNAGNTVEGIYWNFDVKRYAEYNATVIPNSIFLPVTHTGEGGRLEGRYWLEQGWYFEFYQNTDPEHLDTGIVEIKAASEIASSDKKGALRLVHAPVAQ